MKRLLTIQDLSCVGQCSTTVALPLVSVCGVECSVLPPALLSNHTGPCFSTWSFCDLTAELRKVEAKWVEQKIAFDAFYTGYVCEQHIEPILSIMRTCASEGALRIIDPAMADDGRLYPGFAADFPQKIAKLCSGADYILPNLTEAALLTGRTPKLSGYAKGEIEDLIRDLHRLGSKNVVLTGVAFEADRLGSAISDGNTVKYDFNKRFPHMFHGTGDIFASVFAGLVVSGKTAFEAAEIAADFVCDALNATNEDHPYGVSFEKVIPNLVKRLFF